MDRTIQHFEDHSSVMQLQGGFFTLIICTNINEFRFVVSGLSVDAAWVRRGISPSGENSTIRQTLKSMYCI